MLNTDFWTGWNATRQPGTDRLRALVEQGWKAAYAEFFGNEFVYSLDSSETEDRHHSEAITWHWVSRLDLLEGKIPEYYAYFPIWGRGNMKSSIAEAMVVIDATLSIAYGQGGYCLYIGREKERVRENIGNLESLLSSPSIKSYAPDLSDVARNEETNSKRQWTGTFLHTKAGYIIKGGTVESTQAGSRIKHLQNNNLVSQRDTRVTFFVPDDIDSREDSPVIAENRFKLLTTEILPMKQENTLTFFAQNLINRYSVMYRIQKGGARVLTNRKPTVPIPAVRDLVTEVRTVNGIVKDVVVSGHPTWRVWDLDRVQNEIDTMGLPAFLRECQHDVEQSKEGVILYNYNDDVHVISESEFTAVYGPMVWKRWRKKPGNDWARTKTDKHANVAGWWTVSDQFTPLPNFKFFIKQLSFPANSAPEDVAERLLECLSPFAYGTQTWAGLRKEVLGRSNAAKHTKTVAEQIAYEHGELAQVVPKYSKPLLQRCNAQAGDMSHEMDTVRRIYNGVYGLGMRGRNPKKHGGVEAINRDMRIDWDKEHPFRPGEKGYSIWFMVVPDDKSRPYRQVGALQVYRPRPYPESYDSSDLVDSDLARFQFTNWRYIEPKLTEAGERIDEPLKLLDDFPNLVQMLYVGGELSGTSLTTEQKIDMVIPAEVKEQLKTKEVPNATTATDAALLARLNYDFHRKQAIDTLFPEQDEYDEWI